MFEVKYLSEKHLKGFNKYKYSAIDTSPLSQYVMHPTWNALVKLVPKSIAPNVITFLGFLCVVAAVILLTVYDYDFYASGGRQGQSYESEIPSWVFMSVGVLIFLAYNLDGMDGKQARRIGVSGPLGELFDHGLDSYVVFLIPYCIISIFGRDVEYSLSSFRGFLIVVSVVITFYISHVEKYNTGTLYLPWGYDLSMWVCSIMFIMVAYDPGYFKHYACGSWTFVRVFELVIHGLGLIATLPVSIYNVYMSYKNRTGLRLPFFQAIKPVWSIAIVTVAMTLWGLKSPNDLVSQHPRTFILLYGTLFSNIATRLIIAEMSHRPCEFIHWMTGPLVTGFVASLYVPQWEAVIIHTLLIVAVLTHVHYGICVVKQICSHLKINCFSVPKEKRK